MLNTRNDTKLHMIILFSDLVANLISVVVAFLIRYQLLCGISKNFDQIWLAVLMLLVIGAIDILISPTNQFSTRGVFTELIDVVKHQVLGIALVIIVLYLAHSATALSRLVFVYYLILGILLTWVVRLILKRYLLKVYRNGSRARRLLIISNTESIDEVEARVLEANDWNILIDKAIAADEYGIDHLLEYATHNAIDEALIYIPNAQEDEACRMLISNMISMGIRVNIGIPQLEVDVAGNRSLAEIGPFTTLSICRNSLTIGQQAAKRSFDIVGGIIGTIIFAITFIILGPIIKLDSSGPIIFKQNRVGKNGRIFDFYKFRSMYVDAEQQKKALSDKNEINGLMFKMEDDPRITKVGKFIRKTSIDELPQFWNVLKGDMSLVGTRPPTVDEYQKYQPWHKSRLSMKPGITGMWQVSGRSDIKDFDQVVALDVQYIDNWSVLTDIKILFKTISVVITGKGSK